MRMLRGDPVALHETGTVTHPRQVERVPDIMIDAEVPPPGTGENRCPQCGAPDGVLSLLTSMTKYYACRQCHGRWQVSTVKPRPDRSVSRVFNSIRWPEPKIATSRLPRVGRRAPHAGKAHRRIAIAAPLLIVVVAALFWAFAVR